MNTIINNKCSETHDPRSEVDNKMSANLHVPNIRKTHNIFVKERQKKVKTSVHKQVDKT